MKTLLACTSACLLLQAALATAASAGCASGARTAPIPGGSLCFTAASAIDTDGDGFGNKCDGDFAPPSTGNCKVNMSDFRRFRKAFNTVNALYDLDESGGAVSVPDFLVFASLYKRLYGATTH